MTSAGRDGQVAVMMTVTSAGRDGKRSGCRHDDLSRLDGNIYKNKMVFKIDVSRYKR